MHNGSDHLILIGYRHFRIVVDFPESEEGIGVKEGIEDPKGVAATFPENEVRIGLGNQEAGAFKDGDFRKLVCFRGDGWTTPSNASLSRWRKRQDFCVPLGIVASCGIGSSSPLESSAERVLVLSNKLLVRPVFWRLSHERGHAGYRSGPGSPRLLGFPADEMS